MDRTLSIPLAVIVERVEIHSRWHGYAWRPSGALLAVTQMQTGMPLGRDENAVHYFAGVQTLDLYPTDVSSYRENIEQDFPRIYVVLSTSENDGDDDVPRLHLVTVAPDEAESYLEGEPGLVHGIPMPKPLFDLISAYIDEHERPASTGREDRQRPVSFRQVWRMESRK
jgi:Protein of unknown function (DUF3305)